MYDYGFRDYSPVSARFTTIDPIRDGSNWFSYVVNDPVNYVDLFGLYVKNNTGHWVLIKLEEGGFVSLAPYSMYDGKNVTDYPYESGETEIHKGKIDGVILYDGSIFKISDSLTENPTDWDISVTINENKIYSLLFSEEKFSFHYSNPISWGLDMAANISKIGSGKEFSGKKYKIGDGTEAGGWLSELFDENGFRNDSQQSNNRYYKSEADIKKLSNASLDKNTNSSVGSNVSFSMSSISENTIPQTNGTKIVIDNVMNGFKDIYLNGIRGLSISKGCTK